MTLQRFFDDAFRRYTVTSALATACDFSTAALLHALGLTAFWSTFWGCAAGGVLAFTLGRSCTFHPSVQRSGLQALRHFAVWSISTLLNASGVPLLLARLPESFAGSWWLVRGAVYLLWNYPMARWFVFRHRSGRLTPPSGTPLSAS